MKPVEIKKVVMLDNDRCKVTLEDGTEIKRKFRVHTKEIRNMKKAGIYTFEIQGWFFYYKETKIPGLLEQYKAPESFRAEERKTGNVRNSGDHKAKIKHNSVEFQIPEVNKPKQKQEPKAEKLDENEEVRHKQFETIKTCIENDIPVYLAGPAGSGKNYTLEQISWELGLEFYFTNSVQQEYKLTGFIDAGGVYHETEFYKAFTKGGIFFLDEMDASIPEVLVLLNAAIANRYFEFPNGRVEAHKNFRVVAAGNTVGTGADDMYTGRLVLDQATLDRFVIIDFDYDENIELHLAKGNKDLVQFIHGLRRQAEQYGIRATFSYRCISQVTKLEQSGMELKTILTIAVFKGMNKDTVNTFNSYSTDKYNQTLNELQRVA